MLVRSGPSEIDGYWRHPIARSRSRAGRLRVLQSLVQRTQESGVFASFDLQIAYDKAEHGSN